jgi:hypothetical protein
LGTSLNLSVSIQSLGAETATIEVVGGLNPTQTAIVSPIAPEDGSYGISFNGDGYSDLLIFSLDSEGRPARSPAGMSYLIEPINEIAEIEPGKSFTIFRVDHSLFGNGLDETISVTPIGINADADLQAESRFYLVSSTGTIAKLTFPFGGIIGSSISHPIGLVQLVDSTGNQILASNDLTVRLLSSDPKVLQVPSEVTIPQGKSFVQFSVTTLGKSGNVLVNAFAEGVGSSSAEISSFLAELEGSFLEDIITATIPQEVTISTTFEGTNIQWGPPPTFEVLSKDDKALKYDPDTNSYLASVLVIAPGDGNFTISATLLKDGFQPAKISKTIFLEPYFAPMIVTIDYQQPTIPHSKPTTINVFVEDEHGPIEDARIEVTPGNNATASPKIITTNENGMGTFEYTVTGSNPKVSLDLIASKDGYLDGSFSIEFEVTDIPTALPPWITYAAIAGVIASVAGGVVYFLKKPKGKRFDEETEEEEEEI